MADYAANIDSSHYLYREELTITERSGEDLTNYPVKLILDATTFDFSQTKSFSVGGPRANNENMTHYASSAFQGGPEDCSTYNHVDDYWRINVSTAWWKVDLGTSLAVGRLELQRWNSAGNDQMVDSFKLSGSNDNSVWYELLTGNAAANGNLQSFDVDSSETYRYYKFDVLSNHGNTYTSLGIIQLFAHGSGDFRVGEDWNGGHIWKMWIEKWDVANEEAIVWLNIPSLSANETKQLYAFWGKENDSGISDPDSIDFLLYDDFLGTSIDTSKWSVFGSYTIKGSRVYPGPLPDYIQTKGNIFNGVRSWALETYVWIEDASPSTGYVSYDYFIFDWAWENYVSYGAYGDTYRTHNFECGGAGADTGTEKGIEGQSYNRHIITYHEPTDTIHQGVSGRNTYTDYLDSWERSCEGNTWLDNFRVRGRGTYGSNGEIDWVIIREYVSPEPEFDVSNLLTEERIDPDVLEYDYGPDLTLVNYEHTSTSVSGGDPTKLSDNIINALDNIWCSDDGDAAGAGIELTIDFGSYNGDVTDTNYLHYDDGHVRYRNASKLSDNDTDESGNAFWRSTTTSGWAAIDFESKIYKVAVLSVKGVSDTLSGMPKNYRIEGSFLHPRDEEWVTLHTGQFSQSATWQTVVFDNNIAYRSYRLYVVDTYGSNIALQEWKMSRNSASVGKKIVSKLRLKPVGFDSMYAYFPKQIVFYGSNDLTNWTELIGLKNTYTPRNTNWQEYTFTNNTYYYQYKLKAIGNWNANTGKICIAEWEMQEKNSEAYTSRVAAGSNDNYGSIWASSDSTFDNLDLYLVNNVISHIENNVLVATETFTGSPTDLIVGE